LHRVLQDWGEGSSDAPGAEGRGTTGSPEDATWDVAMEGVNWVNPGGDFVATPSASTSVAGTGRYTWDSTDMLVADVQRWLTIPEENFGWILIGDESRGRTAKRFHSLQNLSESDRPALNIEFEIGAVLAGDYDEDGSLTPTDIGLLCGAINGGLDPAEFDVDGDGAVDNDDLTVWVQDLAGTNLGDTNLDGSVAFGDFLAVSAAFGQAGTWENGDFDCSGQIAFPDFLVLSANFGKSAAAEASVPEPSALTLLLPTILFVHRRRLSNMEKR
jgi:hypothetical protein